MLVALLTFYINNAKMPYRYETVVALNPYFSFQLFGLLSFSLIVTLFCCIQAS